MPRLVLQILDVGFFILHSFIILLNVFGWIWKPLRRANLAMLLLTLVSWTLMGAFYGVGYCVCTDWHFRVRHALGDQDQGDNYIGFFVWKLTGYLPPDQVVRIVCAVTFLACLTISVALNRRDFRLAKARSMTQS